MIVVELLDSFHCIRGLGRCVTSEAHPAYSRFMALLSNAFFMVDECDLQALHSARDSLQWMPEPTKDEVRKHCRTRVPHPSLLEKHVTAVMLAFRDVTDSNGVPLFSATMLKEWQLQRIHIRRGCLSDPVDVGGVLYRFTGNVQLGHSKKPEAKVATWQSLRGSSQLEGFHPHQAKWVTGTCVSSSLFQAQGFLGIIRWNCKRAKEHRDLILPEAFDPLLTAQLNCASVSEYGSPKYPDFVVNDSETGERFGIDYALPCDSDTKHAFESENHLVAIDTKSVEDLEADLDVALQGELEELLHHPPAKQIQSSSSEAIIANDHVSITFLHDPIRISSSVTATMPSISTRVETIAGEATKLTSVTKVTKSQPTSPSIGSKRVISTDECGIPQKQFVQTSRRKAFGGIATPWSPKFWNQAMKEVINNLLVTIKPPNKYDKVTAAYNRIVYNNAYDPNSLLKLTNAHFIKEYDREICRKLEGSACVNISEDQGEAIKGLAQQLSQPVRVPAFIVRPVNDPRPVIAPSSTIPLVPLGQLALPSPVVQSRRESTTRKPSTRKCKHCGESKLKHVGQQNLHHTHIRKGEPCFFYCPIKMFSLYGTPVNMTFDQFQKTDHWTVALKDLHKKKEQMQHQRAAAIAKHEEKGWKKPGIKTKKE